VVNCNILYIHIYIYIYKPSKTIKDHGKTIKNHGKTLPTHPTRGEDWFTTERFWDSAAAYDPVLAPTMVTPFVGGAPGTWEDL
jgi:hypothetical protein